MKLVPAHKAAIEQIPEILNSVEYLLEGYSRERRATTQPYLLQAVNNKVDNYVYHPGDVLVRETLIEHVGSLPIIATALYPYINDDDVNLGDALIMLAVHDIGELITGDEMTFTKKPADAESEINAGLQLLHPVYHNLYLEAEQKGSKTAQFAKAIDKIAPDILDYLSPADITINRYKHFTGLPPSEIINTIIKAKRPYMLWNDFLTQLHIHLMERLDKKLSSYSD